VWWLGSLVIISILLALGNGSFMYPLVARLFPLFSSIRYPIKFIALAIFALPLLAAYGITAMAEWDSRSFLKRMALSLVTVAGLAAAVLVTARCAPAADEVWSTTLTSGITRLLFLAFASAALHFARRSSPSRQSPLTVSGPRQLAAFVFLLLIGIDGITHAPNQNLTVRNVVYGKLDYRMSAVPKLGEARAMVSPQAQAVLNRASLKDPFSYYTGNRRALFENCNLIDGVPKINGFFSLYLREYSDIKGIVYQPTNYPAGLIDFLGASQLTSDENFWQWVSRPSALPLITGGQQVIFGDRDETLAALQNGKFAPRDIVYLEKSAASAVTATNPTPMHVEQKSFSAQRIEGTVTAGAPAIVVISQAHYPSWKAFVDGKRTQLFRANHAFQALQVPSGTHQISLVYTDTTFYTGALITACSILICALVWIRLIRV
jgi:hypothetical protein